MWRNLLILCAAMVYADFTDFETVVGLDLGATNSYIAAYRTGQVEIIANDQGHRNTPSVVAFIGEERLIGETARQHATKNPENTVFKVKRLLGKEWDEITQESVKELPFKVLEKDNKPYVSIDGVKDVSLEEITAMVVEEMKGDAEDYIGTVSYAVVTVPAYFNDAQRQATKEACEIAGFKILRVINDPIAAAIAYGLDEIEGERNVLVFDMGGTTFDVSILNIDNEIMQTFGTCGDTNLGGESFDQRVMVHFINMLKKRGDDIQSDDQAKNKLRNEVEKAKRRLSIDHSAKIEIKSLFDGKDFSEILTRDKFEELNMDLFKSALISVEKALKYADMSKEDIEEVVLVGGSTKIPKIQELLKDYFGKDPSTSIDPDVVVAYGAAIFANKILKEPEPPVHISMNPLTIGIKTLGRIMTKLIPRNTITPTKKKQVFSTAHDNQETVTIKIYEGERLMTIDNHLLGKFDLIIPPGPKGKPEIEVTLKIDANEVLVVTAEDKHTGVKENITIENNTERWTVEYIERMMVDAEKFAQDDARAKENVINKNELLIEGHYIVKSEEYEKDQLEDIAHRKRKLDEL